MTRPIATYTVAPSIPKELQSLLEIANNLLWVWDHELMELFIRLDPDLWEESNHNPVLMLGTIKQERLNTLSRDDAFLAQAERASARLHEYLDRTKSWYHRTHGGGDEVRYAYFSAEFGITECLQNYSGGLGILSGDHLKSASDLGLPLAGVGLLYQQGYFRQYLNADGWQQERYSVNDFYTMPINLERTPAGDPLIITVAFPGRTVAAQVWHVQVGRIPLYLLDTNIPQNSQHDQDITDQLYGGDRELRIMQEMLLGIGGYRALRALGHNPCVYHMNEGHSAFLALERCRDLMQTHGLKLAEAREAASAGMVFTTHTPVPAGNDYFVPALVDKYLGSFARDLGLSQKDFLGLGRQNPDNPGEDFCMTILALRMSNHSNAVSKLHGGVSRAMWHVVWPGMDESDVPITSITNGVHGPSWVSRDMAGLYDRYLGPGWREDPSQHGLWGRAHHIPDGELWRTHERRRERLVAFARQRLRSQLEARGAPPSEIAGAEEILDSDALTIGFARRFATYKRASLLLRDPKRLLRILTDLQRPVQIIFAGKAHPQDNPGKELIREIVHFERNAEARRRMVFIEDYDMVVARYLVQGVDVWLNTPQRPFEASGTSGMKATLNGAVNLSVLDGWWDEAYTPATGWAIGRGEDYEDTAYQDEVESNALYDLLEKEIVPLFYTRGADGLPRGWIGRMKTAMRAIGPEFNTNRMVRQYAEDIYIPAMNLCHSLGASKFERAKQLASWRERLREGWNSLRIAEVKNEDGDEVKVGGTLAVRASIDLGSLTSDDITVQLCYGRIDADGNLEEFSVADMTPSSTAKGKLREYSATVTPSASGRMGHTVRILPRHEDLGNPFKPGLIIWA